MLFWTIFFLTISLYGVFKGPIFSETGKKLKQLNIRKAEGESADDIIEEYIKAGCLPIIAALGLMVSQIIYLVNAFSYDTYKYPTVLVISFFIVNFIANSMKKDVSKMNKLELAIEKEKASRAKNVTIGSICRGLIWSAYFGYMFYVLVF
ncbi:hypothetical protein [Paenibacillus lactis]|uniref:hypothetical protein n=1 Tax=Paenibacillus lactis TaxID=228574 RepID=UPI003D746FD0